MLRDLITAWRFLLKRPTSTVIAVLTLAVTVALSTIAVGAIDQAFWRPADAARGGELVTFYSRRPSALQTRYNVVSQDLCRQKSIRLPDREATQWTAGQSTRYIPDREF